MKGSEYYRGFYSEFPSDCKIGQAPLLNSCSEIRASVEGAIYTHEGLTANEPCFARFHGKYWVKACNRTRCSPFAISNR